MRQTFVQSNKLFVSTSSKQFLFEIYEAPTHEEKNHLIHNLKIDEHTLAAALNPNSLARVELEFSHVAIVLKTPKPLAEHTAFEFRTTSVGYFLFESHLIIVTPEKLNIIGERYIHRACSPTTVLLHSLEMILDHFGESLSEINQKCDELEDQVNTSTDNRYLLNLFAMEKGMVYFLSAMNTNTFVIEKLKEFVSKFGSTEGDLTHLDAVALENRQCYEQAQIYSSILSSLSSARVSIVSNNLNVLMKTLNLVTIGIMVPTFVVSVFSMNVEIPFQREGHAFSLVLMLAIISVILFIVFFWKLTAYTIHTTHGGSVRHASDREHSSLKNDFGSRRQPRQS
jgi:magnesium transporter